MTPATLCLALAGGALLARVPADSFTLAWTHSVARTGWEEAWRVADGRLRLETARVQGTGAGMEPPPEARLEGGWFVWHPQGPPLERLVLAASPFGGEHRLCAGGACRPLHAWLGGPAGGSASPGPVELRACPEP